MGWLFLNKKAQIFSWDVLISVGLFVFILVASLSVWDSYREKTLSIDTRAEMQMFADNAMNTLILMPGNPGNWHLIDDFNVSSFGLVGESDYLLDVDKITKIQELNNTYYNEVKSMIGIREYEMHLEFILEEETYSFGIERPFNSKEVVVIERLCVIENEIATIRMEVWDE